MKNHIPALVGVDTDVWVEHDHQVSLDGLAGVEPELIQQVDEIEESRSLSGHVKGVPPPLEPDVVRILAVGGDELNQRLLLEFHQSLRDSILRLQKAVELIVQVDTNGIYSVVP